MVIAIVFAIIFIGFLLGFGFEQIQNFFCMSEKANTLRVVNELKNRAESLYTKAQGSTDLFDLRMPGNSKVCFFFAGIETPHYVFNRDYSWVPDEHVQLLISDPLSSQHDSNVWIYYCGGSIGFEINHLEPNVGPPGNKGAFCVPASQELWLENKGTHVSIELNE